MSVSEQLTQIITQLDGLIRGRKIDPMHMQLSASVLLSSSFEFQPGAKEEGDAIAKQSVKILNMLRSPRFSSKEVQNVFSILRAATSVLLSVLKEDEEPTSNSILEFLRLMSKSAAELSQLSKEHEQALNIIEILEEKWSSLEQTMFEPIELKECEQLVAETLLLKSDILSKCDQVQETIDVLTNPELKRILVKHDIPVLILASKAFQCGQKLLRARETSVDSQHENAALATRCYAACLHHLQGDRSDHPQHPIKGDENDLKSKCYIQLALAYHLIAQNDDALDALDKVESKELLEDTEDLRLGILLAAKRFDKLHHLIQTIIQKLPSAEGFHAQMHLGDVPQLDRMLLLLRRVGFATCFESDTVQHYQQLQVKWQDDQRYLEIRTQLLAGLLENAQRSVSPSEGRFKQSLDLYDLILHEHIARQRMLSEAHLGVIEVALTHALNGTISSENHESVVELSDRLIKCIDISLDSMNSESLTESNREEKVQKYAHALVIHADALLELNQVSKSLQAAIRSFDLCPSSEAFKIRFDCLYKGGGNVAACTEAIQVLEAKKSKFASPVEVLDALSHIIVLVGENEAYASEGRDGARDTGKTSLSIDTPEDIEVVALATYTRIFEEVKSMGRPMNMDTTQGEETSSFAGFLLRMHHIGKHQREGTLTASLENRLLLSTQSILTGSHFLLQEEGVGHFEYATKDGSFKVKLLSSHEEAHSLGMACWDIAERLKDRGLIPTSGVDESGFCVTTNLLLAAHELLLAADCIEKNGKPESGVLVTPVKLECALNRAVLLTIASSNVIDSALFSASGSDTTNTKLSDGRLVQVRQALEWVAMAQSICEEVDTWNHQQQAAIASTIMEYSSLELALVEKLMETQTSLRVTLSTLRLMSGINGVYSIQASSSGDLTNKDEDLKLVEDCKEDLAIVPSDTLRATASAMKQRGKSSVACSILNIAIERLQLKLKISPETEIIKQLLTLSCDKFNVSPSIDSCLKVVEDILSYLAVADQMDAQPLLGMDISDIDRVTCLCYNWGLQGLSLGSVNSGSESERLIGKAQQLLRYCPNLLNHEDDFAQAYQRALEVKEQQHEAIAIHTQRMDVL